jgi:carbamoyltransferase
MKVLGIMWEQNSTAALMVDGVIVASASEERFSRAKNDGCYPKQAIEYVLREGGIKSNELDAIAFMGHMWGPMYSLTKHYSSFNVEDNLREQHEYWKPLLYEGKKPDYLAIFKDKLDLDQYPGKKVWKKVIADMRKQSGSGRAGDEITIAYFKDFRRQVVAGHLAIAPEKIHFIDHSSGHAAYAYFASPVRADALVVTADAWGDNVNASLTEVRKGMMKRIYETNTLALARLYRYTTLILGMKPNEHEYKVMGLAPYAKKKYYQKPLQIFRSVQKVNGVKFEMVKKPSDFYFYFLNLLEGVRFDAIAGALQEYTEEILLTWFTNAVKKIGLKTLCFAGGVAMNVKANMLINRLPNSTALHINPSPDDSSQAMGACYAYMYDVLTKQKKDPRAYLQPLAHAYLGPAITDAEIEKLIAAKKIEKKYRVMRTGVSVRAATLLAEGKVIARAAGRSEFGARSLGNRSILADARNQDVVAVINEKVKNRDFWMPFAPTILESRAKDYVIGYRGNKTAAYMTVGFDTTPLGQKHLRAGLHPSDKTCRPQILPAGQNPKYEALLKAFEKKTGVGGLLNTSFNLHGEPIVQTAADAWRVFELSDLDALLLNEVLIEKK